jgi:hypothetical protein
MPVNWENFKTPDVAGNVMKAFEEGRRLGQERRVRNALADFEKDPTSPVPINALISLGEPQKALALYELQTKREAAGRDASYRAAQGRYFTNDGQFNALAPQAAQPTRAAIAPGNAPEPQQHPLGVPQSEADSAFLEMLKNDPKRAFETRGAMRDEAIKRLKVTSDAYDMAISQLANVRDDAGYQELLGAMHQRFAPIGVDIRSMVPPRFPGPQGVRSLLMTAVGAKDQLHAIVERDRLNAYVADIDSDNTRADRNTDSLISSRSGHLGEARRYHDATIKVRERGQDLGASTARRGQDMRGKGRTAAPTATGPNGQKVQWNGKAWVPIK